MMENQHKTHINSSQSVEETDFNWKELLLDIWAIRTKLYKAAAVGAVVGLIIAFSIPKQYSVSVTLAPEMGNAKGGGSLASLASSFLGAGMLSSGPDALNALQAPEIVSSTPFLLELMDSRVVNEENKIDTTFASYLEMERKPWWRQIISFPRKIIGGIKSLFLEEKLSESKEAIVQGPLTLSNKESVKIGGLRKKITASVDKKTGIIKLSVSLQDPVITAIIVDSVVSKLQKEIVKYKISKAEQDYNYWKKIHQENKEEYYKAQQKYAQHIDSNSNVILQSTLVESERLKNEMSLAYQMYTQVSQQLQLAQAKMQEAKPAFIVIEPSVVPLQSIGMGKIQCLLLFSFLAVGIFICWELKEKYIFKSMFKSKF